MSVRPDADAELRDWSIEKVVPGGDGMARLADGRVAFVEGAFPGDVIRPVAVEARKGHVRATRWSLVSGTPERVAPACPVASACGGCDWMALGRRAQLTEKTHLLREALERTGGFTDADLPARLSVIAVGAELAYRSRVRFHVDGSGRVGFFARGSHLLVEVPACIVCRPEINEALAALRRVPLSALTVFSEIEIRVAELGPKIAAHFVARAAGGVSNALKGVASKLPADWSVSVEGDRAPAPPDQRYLLPGGTALFAAPGVFTQVNWPVNVALVEAVVEGARARGVRRFLDAYAGAGNFSLPLLAVGMTGVSVERDARAVECARRAAKAQSLTDKEFVTDDAAHHLAGLARRGDDFDLALLDPPRSGARDVLDSVVKLAPRFVACCSCDPVTLARDLRVLAANGYRLDDVRGFDMFPSTHHLETLSWMSRVD